MNNGGFATVEMSIVMPIIIIIIMIIIRLYLSVVGEGRVLGEGYKSLYQYTVICREKGSGENLDSIFSPKSYSFAAKNGEVRLKLEDKKTKTVLKTEYDKCTSRLRRWQLYGNIICE